MKLLAKISLFGAFIGVGATGLYAQPGFGQQQSASTIELMQRAQMLRTQSSEDLQHAYHLQALARREKDVIKLNCVNDKVVQMKPQLNIMEREQTVLSAGEPQSAFQQIESAAQSVRRLREQADQCVGEGGLNGAESTNGFTAPPFPDDPNQTPWNNQTIEPPAYASPFT